jgi:pimeloyl-ACP methyl ester carboxylesterase
MSPVARALAAHKSLIEAMQTKLSIAALIDELREQITEHAQAPVVLIGHSWGAWLCLLFSARHPALVARLVLVSCAVLEDQYADTMRATQLARLTGTEAAEMARLQSLFADPTVKDKSALLRGYGQMFAKTENYDAEPERRDRFKTDPAIFSSVWTEAAALRTSGELLRRAGQVKRPVLAIHGDYDPSPADGVREPLARVLTTPFEFVLLKNCGHTPWLERRARAEFYEILRSQLA